MDVEKYSDEDRKKALIKLEQYKNELACIALKGTSPAEKTQEAQEIFKKMRAIYLKYTDIDILNKLDENSRKMYIRDFGENFFEGIECKTNRNKSSEHDRN